MKILVTGGAGFIGSHVVDKYIEMGHTVSVIDDLSTGKTEFVNARAKCYQLDIRNRAAVTDVFKAEKPEILNHHAAQMDVRKSVADPVTDAEVNSIGFLNIMEEGRKHGLKHVIFASSGGTVYGETDNIPTPENEPTRPTSPYGITKLTTEYYLYFYQQTYDITSVSLRYGNVYGPRQNPHGEAGVVAIFIKKLLAGEQPIINGDGKQSRDFVYVGDVVEANTEALYQKKSLTVNIGTGKSTTINQIFELVTQYTNSQISPVHGPAKAGEQLLSVLDATVAKKELNWTPRITLEEGLKLTVEYFRHE